MSNYQFPEFPNFTFVDPIVTPDSDNIRSHVSSTSISVPVTLTGSGYAPSVVWVKNIPVDNLAWKDEENLMMRVNEGLVQYEV